MQPPSTFKQPNLDPHFYSRSADFPYKNWQFPTRYPDNSPFAQPSMSRPESKNRRKQAPMTYDESVPMQLLPQQSLDHPNPFTYPGTAFQQEPSYYEHYYQNYPQGYPTAQSSSHDYPGATG
ncbi:hypothetical protein Ciccas_001553 [Cichlidogyrus casuarinus]|uniref:Enamelin n=1 Tax=Cichlidogyrus casuarinus TaxID=1844966 RepID=A0ABD2QJZ4_9PLAT